MGPIRKRILTDEMSKPVAVQIDYADWLAIEGYLAEVDPGHTQASDLSAHHGVLTLKEDPLLYQTRLREEWM